MWHFLVTELFGIQKREFKTAKMKNVLLVSSSKEHKLNCGSTVGMLNDANAPPLGTLFSFVPFLTLPESEGELK